MNLNRFARFFSKPAFTVLAASLLGIPELHAAPFELTVVHVNDTHSHAAGVNTRGLPCLQSSGCTGGYARIAAFIGQHRADYRNVLALDAGDAWQGTLFFNPGDTGFSTEIERRLPYDAITLGNHEFDLGCAQTASYVNALDKPVLAANVIHDNACPLSQARLRAYKIFTFDDVRVAVIGLANNEVREVSKACAHTRFLDTRLALRKTLDELKALNVRHVIVLSHLGYDIDQQLARTVPGVDLFVGGHTHSVLGSRKDSEGPYPTIVASSDGTRSLIVQAGMQTRFAGSITLTFDNEGHVSSYVGELRELTADMPQDPALEALVKPQAQAVSRRIRQIVAHTQDMGDDGLDYCRKAECPSGLLTADAYLAFGRRYGARIALVNSGSIRSALPVGDVSFADLQNIHPFGNQIGIIEMTGREIRAALEHGLSAPDVIGPRLLQPAGLRYAVRSEMPTGHRLGQVQIRTSEGGWRELSDNESVRVVLCDYLLKGGDAFGMIKNAAERSEPVFYESSLTDLQAVMRHVQSLTALHHGRLPAPETGRIRGLASPVR